MTKCVFILPLPSLQEFDHLKLVLEIDNWT